MSSSRRSRWPLLVIGASAGTATWSGWVGLGSLVGFGLVHPLPGIWDRLVINTAITLPIGVEAYAVYALAVATSGRLQKVGARRYAWASAAAALLIGMAGQVTYHLLAAAGARAAPWWIVTAVSCLPVAVLGAASVLWHVAGSVGRVYPGGSVAPISVPQDEGRTGSAEGPVPTWNVRPASSETADVSAPVEQPTDARRQPRRSRLTPPRRQRADTATLAAIVAQVRLERPEAGEPAVRRRLTEAGLAASGERVRAALAEARAAQVRGSATS